MNKILHESLKEYRLHEAEDGDKSGLGVFSGTANAITTAPGRVLRKVRTRGIMIKYKAKLIKRINEILPKYVPNFKTLITKTINRMNNIDSTQSEEHIGYQKKEILEDLEQNMKSLLDSLKNAMNAQLKVYDDSLHARLDRPGTITGVEFYPEEKTELLSLWTNIQTEIASYIHDKLLSLIDNKFISQYQTIKADLEEYIRNQTAWKSTYVNDKNDESAVKDPTQQQILKILKNMGLEAKKPYKVLQPNNFEEPPPRNSYFVYSNDANGNIFYWFATMNSKNQLVPIPQSKQYFARQGDTTNEWKGRIFKVQQGGVQPPVKPVSPTT